MNLSRKKFESRSGKSFRELGATIAILLHLVIACQSKIVIGILTLDADHLIASIGTTLKNNLPSNVSARRFLKSSTYIDKNYIMWLESLGMVPLPLDIHSPIESLLNKIDEIDGLFLTGGKQKFWKNNVSELSERIPTEYLNKVANLIDKIILMNENGTKFPIWAHCLGFEALLVTQSNFTLTRTQMEDSNRHIVPLDTINEATVSARFFDPFELNLLKVLPLLYFHHRWGFNMKEVQNNPFIGKEVDIVGTVSRQGIDVAAWIEFKKYPFFGVQFHAEKFLIKGKKVNENTLNGIRKILNFRFGQFFKSYAIDRNRQAGLDYKQKTPVCEIIKTPLNCKNERKVFDLLLYRDKLRRHRHNKIRSRGQ
jgi:hypothetical protein